MMSTELLLALVLFAFVSSVTPGPNNMMLLSSGITFGFRRTIPHMLGIAIGFTVMVVLVGLGMAQVFERLPILHTILKYAGALYMLWLAWRIARSDSIDDGVARAAPMTFLQAAAFQWVNPKAWVMAISATAAYANPDRFTLSIILVALIFGVVNLPSVGVWALFGAWLRRFLKYGRAIRLINLTLAMLLVVSVLPVFLDLMRH